jgi:Ca-activated chloride channel family protein
VGLAWPLALLALLVVPLLLGAYLWQLRRRRRAAVRYSSVALIRSAMTSRSRWRRHLPVALFLVALAALAFASARPQAAVDVPFSRTSVILALDVSGSMCSTDVRPNRLAVAQEAARRFVQNQPSGMRIGIVAFSEFAETLVPPSRDRKQLIDAINGLTTGRGTAIGAAMLKAVDSIASINPRVVPITANENDGIGKVTAPAAVSQSGYIPDIIVVLTDGRNTRGIDPAEAAKIVAKRRVRVYTIGFGTTNPAGLACTSSQLGGDPYAGGGGGGFGGGGGGGGGGGFQGRGGGFGSFLVADYPALQNVSRVTGGRFYKAQDAGQLQKVFANLPQQVTTQHKRVELSAAFVAIGALLAGGAMVLSLLWNRSP